MPVEYQVPCKVNNDNKSRRGRPAIDKAFHNSRTVYLKAHVNRGLDSAAYYLVPGSVYRSSPATTFLPSLIKLFTLVRFCWLFFLLFMDLHVTDATYYFNLNYVSLRGRGDLGDVLENCMFHWACIRISLITIITNKLKIKFTKLGQSNWSWQRDCIKVFLSWSTSLAHVYWSTNYFANAEPKWYFTKVNTFSSDTDYPQNS